MYLLDGESVVQPAQFCKAGEVSVSFELDAARASSAGLAIAPCTFAADKGAQLEVEVVAPDAPRTATRLTLSASSGVDPRTLSAETAAAASKGVAGAPAGKAPMSKGTAAKSKAGGSKAAGRGGAAAAGGVGMVGAKKTVMGMSDLYGGLE